MKPTPIPSPNLARPQPIATVTVTGTVKVVQDPNPATTEDQLQGWGTVAAVVVALVIALIGWKVEAARRTADKEAGDTERSRDRADATLRLHQERAAADRRLQQQLDEQRDRDRRQFVAEQLQKAANIWAHGEIHLLPGVLVAIPDQYATILRYLVTGEDYNNISGFPPMSQASDQALFRQLTARGLEYHGREQYLVDKMQEQIKKLAQEGKGSSWASMHPRSRELYRGGWDFKKIKHAWLYEEIGENIAEVLGGDPAPTDTAAGAEDGQDG